MDPEKIKSNLSSGESQNDSEVSDEEASMIERVKNMLNEAPPDVTKQEYFVNKLHEKVTRNYSGVEKKFDRFFQAMSEGKFENDDEMITYGIREWRKVLRDQISSQDWEELNRLGRREGTSLTKDGSIYYHLDEESLFLHVGAGKPLEALSEAQKIILLREGMGSLVHELRNNDKLQDITTIKAVSWIVARRGGQKILKRYGFEIDGPIDDETRQRHFRYENREVWSAHVDKDEFLRRFDDI
ncbi:MAG: hypothetical protein A3E37_01955 [Candidatus Andersenbacteria bacterium RIFCSPHIGHO2_12_FULL_46_9]|nr:MAG: hypothetical protein UW94_C0015G0015 [Parcubacteria group bacterium GW2011_GWA2_45_14]OGY33896.1 MAG: hypothetical protein A3B76_01460 [Candidatus Andersenbacteria bacterium RIFCSPHIGHO2_02_FULL_46_16]OGY36028.1 MAG: hypothetical protein A3I08_02860 [Candidatus Andersenbacteria bacterium RIFCSPLOWO2_02_FULL_46_11]OGY36798.1 MAG: hypothetical protein A3E37_01955 [Candidatus Andersenbacteria bacterium RIFCSPHIGHO2_12_FULL_46_9]OGY38507.1 MAG: hypothetical protein A3G57_00415 [Candidatus A